MGFGIRVGLTCTFADSLSGVDLKKVHVDEAVAGIVIDLFAGSRRDGGRRSAVSGVRQQHGDIASMAFCCAGHSHLRGWRHEGRGIEAPLVFWLATRRGR